MNLVGVTREQSPWKLLDFRVFEIHLLYTKLKQILQYVFFFQVKI